MKDLRKGMPTHYQIFDYWKDRQIGKTWVLDDYGEPQCWGCGATVAVETDEDLATSNYKAIWNRTNRYLQRCHIVPKALGGSNEPENMFLLCESCHHESPDTTSREGFLTWVLLKRSHCTWGRDAHVFYDNLESVCRLRNVGVVDLFMYLSTKYIPKFMAELMDKEIMQAGNFSEFNIPVLIVESFEREREEFENRLQDIRRECENRYSR